MNYLLQFNTIIRVAFIVAFSICLLATIISMQSTQILQEEAHSTLMSVAKTNANNVMAGFDGTASLVENAQNIINRMLQNDIPVNEEVLKIIVSRMLDSGFMIFILFALYLFLYPFFLSPYSSLFYSSFIFTFTCILLAL